MNSDLELLQMLLDSEPAITALGFPINAQAFTQAVRAIREASASSSPERVATAWNALAGAIGPKLTAAFLSGEEWTWICRPTKPLDDYDSTDLSQAVWVSESSQVVGRALLDGQHLLGVRFDVEAR